MNADVDYAMQRIDKMDAWLQRLTEVSVDLKSMLAVHEQRLMQHDKQHDYIEEIIEKRRAQIDGQIDSVYNTMRDQDNRILEELQKMRVDTSAQHMEMSIKISKLEKFVWTSVGAGMVGVWLLTYAINYWLGSSM